MLRITGGLHHLSVNDVRVYISQYDVFLFFSSTVLLTDVQLKFHNSPQNFLQQYEPVIPYVVCLSVKS